MKSTLVISGTEDVSVPAANSLILAEKIPDLGLFRLKEVDMGYVPVFGTVQQDCENISRKPRTHVGRGYIKAVPQGINKDNNN